ncbi:unnamed protein product, partial [Ectocarpus fasciculatus]
YRQSPTQCPLPCRSRSGSHSYGAWRIDENVHRLQLQHAPWGDAKLPSSSSPTRRPSCRWPCLISSGLSGRQTPPSPKPRLRSQATLLGMKRGGSPAAWRRGGPGRGRADPGGGR